MKSYNHLFEQVIDINNCFSAIINASKHKTKREIVQHVLENIEWYAFDLQRRLIAIDFITEYREKVIIDGPSKKERTIHIPSFYPDQCAHYALMQVMIPYILKSSYYWSCANIKGRGIKRACIGMDRALNRDPEHCDYCGKFDIKKNYPSTSHPKLKAKLKEKFHDEPLYERLNALIDSYIETKCPSGINEDWWHSEERGLPIGNYPSPWLMELFMQDVDNMILETGISHYVRYADDMVSLDNDVDLLHYTKEILETKLNSKSFRLKENWQVFKVYDGQSGRKVDFVGRCFGKNFATVRKRTALRLMRRSRYLQQHEPSFTNASGFISQSACVLYTDSWGFKKKYVEPVNLSQLKEVVRKESYGQNGLWHAPSQHYADWC